MINLNISILNEKEELGNGLGRITSTIRTVPVSKIRLSPFPGRKARYEALVHKPEINAPHNDVWRDDGQLWLSLFKSENKHIKFPVIKQPGIEVEI